MIKNFLIILFFISFFSVKAQVENDSIDTKYLEDQIYLSLVYNILNEKPSTISQNGFSGGIALGFIKDLPINETRNIGFGVGLGYSYAVYIQNLKITSDNNLAIASVATDYNVNRFRTHAIELPIEFRWRNSTPTKYKFWRIYGGVKVLYAFAFNATYKDAETVINAKNISEFNQLQSGLFISAGYSTWNLYIYYGLTPIFKGLDLDGKKLDLKEINVGLKFYIM
ncbi:porin family protein [Lutibacter maritimus]|uniref:Outer membrane protein beta-barrel domain-containing protein n=1 Tax=Lutibacter maritimus TaxID=593133 RepID=A0A1I6Q2N7_9FLAO|nr:porin family protein [Lutibacter maritimus]SFS46769.1 Outer membrane protein beta-barrel domain-containing protein [Lutibacter maritimus]